MGRRPHAPEPGSLAIRDARSIRGEVKNGVFGRQLIACSKAQAQIRQRALAAGKGTLAWCHTLTESGSTHRRTAR